MEEKCKEFYTFLLNSNLLVLRNAQGYKSHPPLRYSLQIVTS